MAMRINENMWCYNTSDCMDKAEYIMNQQIKDNETFMRFLSEFCMNVAFLVITSYFIILLMPKNLYKLFIDVLHICFCVLLFYLCYIMLFHIV